MSRQPRFEIVRTAAGWHARFRAANGRVVWTTEVYTRRRAAVNAVGSMVDPFLGCWLDSHSGQIEYRKDSWNKVDAVLIEVREVDERTTPAPEARCIHYGFNPAHTVSTSPQTFTVTP